MTSFVAGWRTNSRDWLRDLFGELCMCFQTVVSVEGDDGGWSGWRQEERLSERERESAR